MFQIYRVDRRRAEAVEPLGTKRKFWFSEGERRILFKAEERGTGEDWSEVVACHLCELLGLPHVHYELAEEWDASTYIQPGVVCETCAPAPISLILGNQLLLQRDPAYPAEEGRKYKVREHTVEAVADVIRKLMLPAPLWMAKVPAGVSSALDVFAGYVLLDAWIANQDRHHENWAALREGDELRLAPTFDHGASLARNVSDTERKDRLSTKDQNRTVGHFARRARSAFYGKASDAKPLGTFQAFSALAHLAPGGARCWLDCLTKVPRKSMQHILAEVPPKRMSKIARRFTLELLTQNQERLLKEGVL
jgi:hypothetical protein